MNMMSPGTYTDDAGKNGGVVLSVTNRRPSPKAESQVSYKLINNLIFRKGCAVPVGIVTLTAGQGCREQV